jgi:hypothetical protein
VKVKARATKSFKTASRPLRCSKLIDHLLMACGIPSDLIIIWGSKLASKCVICLADVHIACYCLPQGCVAVSKKHPKIGRPTCIVQPAWSCHLINPNSSGLSCWLTHSDRSDLRSFATGAGCLVHVSALQLNATMQVTLALRGFFSIFFHP